MKVLRFDDTAAHRDYFRYIFAAVNTGPQLSGDGQPAKRTWDEQRQDGAIMRALKAISHDDVLGKGTANETRVRVLNEGGGMVTLTASQFDKLKAWWGRMTWPMYDIDTIEDCYEWWIGAPDVDAE